MASLTVVVERNDHIADFNTLFGQLGQAYMEVALIQVQAAVQRNAPVNDGIFRGSIKTQVLERVQDVGSTITGAVFSEDNPIKVAVIETGRGANKKFPPIDVIRRWVQKKIGPSILTSITSQGPQRGNRKRLSKAAANREAEGSGTGPRNTPFNRALNQAAFLIARKIAKLGIAGKHVFQRSFTETEPEVQRILGEDFPKALAKRL